ncbi:MAG: GatB/YqeY domain-containing protein [Chloroflexi bacterium]|nr:GatB/YqeY domain-containing protein [Chloroflexota bacterium]
MGVPVRESEPDLKSRLMEDVKEAMRRGDTLRVSTLRLLRAAIRNAEIAQMHELDDTGVLAVIVKEVKQRRESIEEFGKGGRPDLVAKEEAEMAILQSYLPAAAEPAEIREAAQRVIAETGAQSPRDIGKVMPRLVAQFRGRADGRTIQAIVGELLARQ